MDKTQESIGQLFLLIRSQGALLSATIKLLIEKDLIDKEVLRKYEAEVMNKLDAISTIASEGGDVKQLLIDLENYVFKGILHVA
jgi:hypothetical protein